MRTSVLPRRLVAGVVDALILTPPSLAATWALGEAFVLTAPAVLAIAGLDLLYRAGFESSRWQATPGKRWLRLRVAGVAGERLSVGRAVLRTLPFWGGTLLALLTPATGLSLFTALAWLAAPLCLAWLPVSGWRQGLHDALADAVVERTAIG